MAKKYTIDLEVNQNAQKASKDFDKLNKSIKGTNDEFEKTEKTMGNAQGVDKLTQRLAELDAQLESGDVSLRDMNKLIMEYQTVAAQAGSESPVGDQAIQKAAALQDQVTDLRNRTKLLSSDYVALDTTLAGIGVGAQAFSGITSAMALTGVESEKLREAMLKVQAVQGVANSISAITNALNKDAILGIKARIVLEKAKNVVIGKSTGLMKGLRVAMAATGIGLLVAGIVALITNFKELFSFMDPVINKLKEFGDWIGITNFAEEEAAAERERRHQEELERIEREKEAREDAFNTRQNQYNREIALAEALGKSTRELREEQLKDSKEFNKKEGDLLKEKINNAQKLLKSLQDDDVLTTFLREETEKTLDELLSTQRDYYEKVKDADNDLKIFKINNRKEDAANEKADQQKRLSNYKTYLQNRINAARKIEDQENQLLEEGIEKELEINRDKFRREREDLERNKNLQRDERIRLLDLNLELEAQAEQKIRDKYAKQKQAEDEKREKESFKILKSIKVTSGQKTLNLLNEQLKAENAAVIAFDKERQRIEQEAAERRKRNIELAIQATRDGLQIIADLTEIFAGKSEKQQRQAFKVQKAINIANATIDTYQAANVALKSAPPPFNYVAVAAAITTGFLNIKKIASTKFEGGGDTGGGATPTGGGLEAGGGGAITPEFNVVGDSGINQLAQLQQQPVQAYVVSGEVTTAQALDRNRVQNATL